TRMNDVLLRDVSDFEYDSYRLVAELQLPDGTPLQHAQTIISPDSLRAVVSQEHVFRTSTFAPPEVFFPYRNLGLKENAHEVVALVKGYPHQTGQARKTEPDILLKVRIGIRQPRLYVGQITVEHFAVDGTK